MDNIKKAAMTDTGEPVSPAVLAKINAYTLTPLEADQVFTFSINACDDQIDRQGERFSLNALNQLAQLYLGKTVIFDHAWTAEGQTARIFDATVTEDGGVHRLRLTAYMLKSNRNAGLIDSINAGILKEVSVGCAVDRVICSVCGCEYYDCGHRRGETYNGKKCVPILDNAVDAYEVSFVAVPAQPGAGVTKSATARLLDPDGAAADKEHQKALKMARAKLALHERNANF